MDTNVENQALVAIAGGFDLANKLFEVHQQQLNSLGSWCTQLEGQVATLSKVAVKVPKKRRIVIPVLVGVYVGMKLSDYVTKKANDKELQKKVGDKLFSMTERVVFGDEDSPKNPPRS